MCVCEHKSTPRRYARRTRPWRERRHGARVGPCAPRAACPETSAPCLPREGEVALVPAAKGRPGRIQSLLQALHVSVERTYSIERTHSMERIYSIERTHSVERTYSIERTHAMERTHSTESIFYHSKPAGVKACSSLARALFSLFSLAFASLPPSLPPSLSHIEHTNLPPVQPERGTSPPYHT